MCVGRPGRPPRTAVRRGSGTAPETRTPSSPARDPDLPRSCRVPETIGLYLAALADAVARTSTIRRASPPSPRRTNSQDASPPPPQRWGAATVSPRSTRDPRECPLSDVQRQLLQQRRFGSRMLIPDNRHLVPTPWAAPRNVVEATGLSRHARTGPQRSGQSGGHSLRSSISIACNFLRSRLGSAVRTGISTIGRSRHPGWL